MNELQPLAQGDYRHGATIFAALVGQSGPEIVGDERRLRVGIFGCERLPSPDGANLFRGPGSEGRTGGGGFVMRQPST